MKVSLPTERGGRGGDTAGFLGELMSFFCFVFGMFMISNGFLFNWGETGCVISLCPLGICSKYVTNCHL